MGIQGSTATLILLPHLPSTVSISYHCRSDHIQRGLGECVFATPSSLDLSKDLASRLTSTSNLLSHASIHQLDCFPTVPLATVE
ncbi:hypothetical protein F5Y18DRAFT_404457 [Xylariaceae sp. FL1019]|nr:hypothetical protein F5Y18DRAFT_404457 [Xylariaceae sp. FL1019]